MELNGRPQRARGARSPLMWLALLAGVGLAGAGLADGDPNLVLSAVLPLALALVYWLRSHRSVNFSLEPAGIQLLDSNRLVPYASMTSISVWGASWSREASRPIDGPIEIVHTEGLLSIPPRMDCAAEDFYEHVAARIPPAASRSVPAALAEHAAAQQQKFGADRVQVILPRLKAGGRPRFRLLSNLGLALLASSVVWLLSAADVIPLLAGPRQRDDWEIGGVVALIFGVVFWLLGMAANSGVKKPVHQARGGGLVISPAGMAMVHGPLKGALTWEEITGVRSRPAARVVDVNVHGGQFKIVDAYETSLDEIAFTIRRNIG